jgi:hypothetical protein
MKITKKQLENIIKEEIQKEVSLKSLGAGLSAAALIGTAGAGMAKQASDADAVVSFQSDLKPVPTRFLEEIYFKATGKPFSVEAQSGLDYRMKLKSAVAVLVKDGKIIHKDGKLVAGKHSVPDHGNK